MLGGSDPFLPKIFSLRNDPPLPYGLEGQPAAPVPSGLARGLWGRISLRVQLTAFEITLQRQMGEAAIAVLGTSFGLTTGFLPILVNLQWFPQPPMNRSSEGRTWREEGGQVCGDPY